MTFSLTILASGAFFVPYLAYASFFSSILGGEGQAEASTIVSNDETNNSQTMDLLEANVSAAAVAAKNTQNSKKVVAKEGAKATKDVAGEPIDPNTDIHIASGNALVPAATPFGSSNEDDIGGVSFDQISVYVVRSGDSISEIADMFEITVDTILSANDMKKGEKLKEGDILLILPFSGVEHTVTKGQTLRGIANLYKVDLADILIHNDIDDDAKLAIGDKLMIPGASMLSNDGKPTSSGSAVVRSSSNSQSSLPSAPGYYVNPVPSARKSRGTSTTHKGVDLAAPAGTPIRAAAAGKVKFARNGYNGGFGNLVIVSHANGTETLYAHQSKIATSVGAQLAQGEILGYVGNTGNSRGNHLHFEVHGAKNPGNDWSWAK